MESSVFRKEFEEAQGKVSQLESQCTVLTNKLIDAGNKCNMLHEQSVKAKKEIQILKKDVESYKTEKVDMSGKLQMVTSKLVSTKADLNRMNKGSKKLDEILNVEIISSNKHGLGFDYGASTSKNTGTFVKGNTLFAIEHAVCHTTHVNSTPKKHMPHGRYVPTCHYCGIIG